MDVEVSQPSDVTAYEPRNEFHEFSHNEIFKTK